MKIIKNFCELNEKNTAVTIGKFDGLHIGHQELFKLLNKRKKVGLKTVVMTFCKYPDNRKGKYIYTKEERYRYYEMLGIDILVEMQANKNVLEMPYETFVKDILIDKLDIKYFCGGKDFRFGKNRMGDADTMKLLGEKYKFDVDIIEKIKADNVDVSSTLIRKYIELGKIEEARAVLGHMYCVIGEVVHGNQLGRTVGMPTINIIPEEEKLLPPNGVYATHIYIDEKKYDGITNVGIKPTVSNKEKMGVETFIFDYNQNVYGKNVIVEFISYIRKEKKFPALEDVKKQVNKDIEFCKKILSIYKN